MTLNELSQRNSVIISNADKGGAVVIQDVKQKIEEAEQQLDTPQYYKMLDSDLTKNMKRNSRPKH